MTSPGKARPQQLPLSFSHESANDWEDLIVSDPTAAAASVVERWPDWPSPVVIIVGPPGAGKSHLASLWQAGAGAVAIHPDGRGDTVPVAAENPVLFEDADRIGFDETELFHVVNAVRSNSMSLLITARSLPAAWNVALPDLASRLKAATVVEIGAPDDLMLTQILFKLFADRQLFIDEKLAAYMVSRMERSFAAAQSLVEKLDNLALARGVRITRQLAGEVLSELSNDT